MVTSSRCVRLFVLFIPLVLQSPSQAMSQAALWPANPLTKVMRADHPASDISNLFEISGACGETVRAQAVFRPAKNTSAVSVSISDLRHTQADALIPDTAARLQWVRYIDIDRNTAGIPEDELVAKAPMSIPDPFWDNLTTPLEANQAQPIWIEVRIPRHAKPGDYEGKFALTAAGQSFEVPIRLHVWDFEMPNEQHLSVINWETVANLPVFLTS